MGTRVRARSEQGAVLRLVAGLVGLVLEPDEDHPVRRTREIRQLHAVIRPEGDARLSVLLLRDDLAAEHVLGSHLQFGQQQMRVPAHDLECSVTRHEPGIVLIERAHMHALRIEQRVQEQVHTIDLFGGGHATTPSISLSGRASDRRRLSASAIPRQSTPPRRPSTPAACTPPGQARSTAPPADTTSRGTKAADSLALWCE